MNKALGLFLLLVSVSAFFACKREEPTQWKLDVLGPIAYGTITLDDLVDPSDSLLQADANGLLHFTTSDTIVDIPLDSLVQVPDTAVRLSFSLPFNGGPFNIPAGTEVFSNDEDVTLNVGDVQLKEIRIKSGFLLYEISSEINGELDVLYDLPGVQLNGVGTALEAETEPGSAGDPFLFGDQIDLTDYVFDLTGPNGVDFNTITGELSVDVSSDASASAEVFGTDSLKIELNFEDVEIAYARGFFGERSIELNDGFSFDSDLQISGNSILFESMSFDLELKNYIGVDVELDIESLNAEREGLSPLALEHTLTNNTQFITRATEVGSGVVPTINTYQLDETNSNLNEWVGRIPDSVSIAANVLVNPLGDISGGNDFVYTDQALELIYHVDVPLCFGTEGIVLTDTLSLDSLNNLPGGSGEVLLYIKNAFPVGGDLSLTRVGAENAVLTSSVLEPASFVSFNEVNVPSVNVIPIVLSEDDLDAFAMGSELVLSVNLKTDGNEVVKLTGDEFMDVKMILDADLELTVD